MTKLYGERAATIFTGLIIWTCLAGLFAMTLGYSRIIYAAAKNGDFFSLLREAASDAPLIPGRRSCC